MTEISRRRAAALIGAVAAAPALLVGSDARAAASGRVVVIGGGFAGATCAKYLRRAGPNLQITLVEPKAVYTSCVFSNEVMAGLKTLNSLQVNYSAFAKKYKVTVVAATATGLDGANKAVVLSTGAKLPYDRLVVAPGIEFRLDAATGIPGYDLAATQVMPHAWQAGPQTTLLQQKLAAFPTGATAIISVPRAPYRCPPAPYERASLMAWYFSQKKKGSKVLILDANDTMPKQALFEEAWSGLYPGVVTRLTASQGGTVRSVDPATLSVTADAGVFTGGLVNIIPPHKAGSVADALGLTDQTGWCPVDPMTFQSTRVPGVHVVGDAAMSGLPKSATSGNAGAKVCAKAIAAALGGAALGDPIFVNTCYSRIAPDYAIGLATVYGVQQGAVAVLNGATGTSPVGASRSYRKEEAEDADGWFAALMSDSFA